MGKFREYLRECELNEAKIDKNKLKDIVDNKKVFNTTEIKGTSLICSYEYKYASQIYLHKKKKEAMSLLYKYAIQEIDKVKGPITLFKRVLSAYSPSTNDKITDTDMYDVFIIKPGQAITINFKIPFTDIVTDEEDQEIINKTVESFDKLPIEDVIKLTFGKYVRLEKINNNEYNILSDTFINSHSNGETTYFKKDGILNTEDNVEHKIALAGYDYIHKNWNIYYKTGIRGNTGGYGSYTKAYMIKK